jgi:hypothetical protein
MEWFKKRRHFIAIAFLPCIKILVCHHEDKGWEVMELNRTHHCRFCAIWKAAFIIQEFNQ